MSNNSLVSLPPRLEMTPHFTPKKLRQIAEKSFPVSPEDGPVNVRILLHAAKQMSSTRPRKVIIILVR